MKIIIKRRINRVKVQIEANTMRSILRRDKGRGGPTGREITRGGYGRGGYGRGGCGRGGYGRGVPATRTVYVQVAVVLRITRGDLRALAVTLEEGSPSRRSCGGHCRDSPSRPPPVARSLTLGMGAGTLTPSHLNSLTVKHFHSLLLSLFLTLTFLLLLTLSFSLLLTLSLILAHTHSLSHSRFGDKFYPSVQSKYPSSLRS